MLTRTAQGGWYGIYYDTLAACPFDFGCEHDNYHGLYRYVEIDDGDLDYYLIAGASPAEVIARFVRLIGGTHLPVCCRRRSRRPSSRTASSTRCAR